ncbi:MAG: Bbp16 family capsid cement protein [Burkholderiaceae bacterium]
MIIDSRLQVSAKQALTETAPSTDVIDLGAVNRLLGPGDPLWWVIVARTGLAGTTPTLAIAVQTDDAANFPSAATLLTHPTLAAAAFTTGTRVVIPMPWQNERYLRLNYTLGGTTPTATVDAFLTNQDPASWLAYPDAI